MTWSGLAAAVVLGVILGIGASGARAGAATPVATKTVVAKHLPLFGPRLAGDRIVWGEPSTDGGYALRTKGAPGGRTSLLFRFRDPLPSDFRTVLSFASSDRLTLLQQASVSTDNSVDAPSPYDFGTIAVRAGVPPERLGESCVLPACGFRAVDLSGNVGIYAGPRTNTATVRDFSAGGATRTLENTGERTRIAGRYAAWNAGRTVVVYDLEAMKELYRVSAPTAPALTVVSLDVQEDGKVAFAYEASVRKRTQVKLAWAAPSAPAAQTLPLAPRSTYNVRIAGDRVVFARSRAQFVSARGEVGVVGLTGPAKLLARPVETDSAGELFDYDGVRIAWAERSCSGARVAVARLADLQRRPQLRKPSACRLRFSRRPRSSRAGTLSFRLDCRGFERACRVRRVTARTRSTYRIGGRTIRRGTLLASKRFESKPSIRLSLSRLGRQLLRMRQPVRLTIAATVSDSAASQRRSTVAKVR